MQIVSIPLEMQIVSIPLETIYMKYQSMISEDKKLE